MKRFFAMIFVFVAALALVACKGGEKFDVDGEFTAFEVTEHGGAPMVTSVTVTIKNGKISKFYIDALQGSAVKEGEVITAVNWNEKTKQELGFEYRMHYLDYQATLEEGDEGTIEGYKAWLKDNNELEWFEQVAKISADVVATQKSTAPADAIAGVTVVTDTYYELIANAFAAVK